MLCPQFIQRVCSTLITEVEETLTSLTQQVDWELCTLQHSSSQRSIITWEFMTSLNTGVLDQTQLQSHKEMISSLRVNLTLMINSKERAIISEITRRT